MHIIDNWKEVLFKTYSVWSMILGFIAFMGSEILYYFWQIEADPYPLGLAALVFFVVGFVGRFIRQDDRSKGLRRAIFLTAFAFGIFMLIKSLGGAVYDDITLPEPQTAAEEQAALDWWAAPNPADAFMLKAMSKPVAQLADAPADGFDEIAFALISKWEGKRNKSYRDVIGVWTICYGHTRTAGPGQFKSDAECKALLIDEIAEYRDGWLRYVNENAKAKWLPATRKAAYTSLAFNIGWQGAGKSTATRRLNAGDLAGGCQAIGWYNKAGGKVWRGLVLRRSEEVGYCMVGVA
tara:strand:- start:27004 stop:27885 length:882 start_codon:yes stop_codon:yes gene_type:complete